tara:strand:- start:16778 stop:17308 length:531 start_codon:yes stop_codon:yes gene_type:complete
VSAISNPKLKQTVESYFAGQDDDAPTWVELHGLICALAVGPCDGPGDFAAALEMELDEPVTQALEELRARTITDMLSGERVMLPCLLDPYREEDGADLASWCAGFLSGMILHEERWYGEQEEDVAMMLLPVMLISGLDDDPALDELWNDTALVRQMANGLPDLLEELLLHFQGPEG